MNYFDKLVLDKFDRDIAPEDFINSFNGIYLYEIFKTLLKIKAREIEVGDEICARAGQIICEVQKPFDREKYHRAIREFCYSPVPHILDSDVRFTKESAFDIAGLLESQMAKGQKLALLGTPSIMKALDAMGSAADRTLYEQNAISIGHDFVKGNVKQIHALQDADVVFCDPPWYPLATKDFMSAAQRIMKLKSRLFIIVPPFGVRDGMSEEYQDLHSFGDKLGFEIKSIHFLRVFYLSAPYEVNALLSVGITNFPFDWRKGNIMIFEKTRNVALDSAAQMPAETDWSELSLGNVRFKMRNQAVANDLLQIEKLAHGDIYPTVSMRTDLKDKVDIWTSGNRIFKCGNTEKFKSVLSAVINKTDLALLPFGKDEIEAAVEIINGVVGKEKEEYADVWKDA